MRAVSSFLLTIGFAFVWTFYFPHTSIAPGNLHQEHEKKTQSCLECHTPFSGIPDSKCYNCHPQGDLLNPSASKKGFIHQKSWVEEKSCLSCHGEHYGENALLLRKKLDKSFFHNEVKGACNNCHVSPTDKMHRGNQSCERCHTTESWHILKEGAAKIFHTKSADCTSCHQKPGDATHKNISGGCTTCHGFTDWKSEFIDHDRYFKLGKKHNKGCEKCHENNNFSAYTCYGCHEHSPKKIRSEHTEHGIHKYDSCVDCHRSGSEKKAKEAWKQIKESGRASEYR